MNYIEGANEKVTKFKDERARRSKCELMKIGLIYFGIELLFSLEIALTVPILLESNVSKTVYSYVYFFSPIFGFIFQPIFGMISDRCESKYGKRRPFIFVLSIFSYIGISLILNGLLLGDALGDQVSGQFPVIGVFLTAAGVTVLDFSADTADSPLRAYLLDTCNVNDQHIAFNLHAFLGGIGGALGYVLAAIDWEQSFLSFIGNKNQILYIIVTVIFFICLYTTMNSTKDDCRISPSQRLKDSEDVEKNGLLVNIPDTVIIKPSSITQEDDSLISNLLKSFVNMPNELWRLFICETVGWIAFFSTTLFFTDFIAQSIYNGDPSSLKDTYEYKTYEYGIRMGSWCLLTYSISSAASAIIVERFLVEKYSSKALLLFTFWFYFICCVSIYFSTNIIVIIVLCSSFGILMTTLTTIPYQMVSEFHQDNLYSYNTKVNSKRGFGIDCSILGSCHFLSQTIVSSFMSLLTSSFGNEVILLVGAFFAFVGFFLVNFYVIFPKKVKNTQ